MLAVTAWNGDPTLTLELGIEARDYGVLRYEARSDAGGVATTQIYFAGREESFAEWRSAAQPLALDGAWHEVRFPLFADPRWMRSGRIAGLRLDGIDRPGCFDLRGLRLENDLDWARRWSVP